MSLKAKLEAVIYAAEEPVTLAQLAAIFAEEALALKAAQESGRAASQLELAQSLPSARADETATEPELELELGQGGSGFQGAVEDLPPAPASELACELDLERAGRRRDREVREILRGVLAELMAGYAGDGRGIEIREIAGGYRMATKPEMHDAVRGFIKSLKPPMKLSLPALETLAVVAYKQPVTAPEVGEIRGVDSAGVLGSLLSRKLIATAGRKQVIGRPILYKTTREFLLRFGLKDLNELPSMEEFEKMAALELSEDLDDLDGDAVAGPGADPAAVAGGETQAIEQPGELFAPPEPAFASILAPISDSIFDAREPDGTSPASNGLATAQSISAPESARQPGQWLATGSEHGLANGLAKASAPESAVADALVEDEDAEKIEVQP